ncbi:hypothetical protein [Selenomonas sputigena]|uniref:hypothetical protein n=1 Tax=Selenomonas sputigena TaxID=69823 RepID=UPI0028E57DCD|nr:hypothetical protein [Selenomonas sputigena]
MFKLLLHTNVTEVYAKLHVANGGKRFCRKFFRAAHGKLIAENPLRRQKCDGLCIDRGVLAHMYTLFIEHDFAIGAGVKKRELLRQRKYRILACEKIAVVASARTQLLLMINIPILAVAIHIGDMVCR